MGREGVGDIRREARKERSLGDRMLGRENDGRVLPWAGDARLQLQAASGTKFGA